MSRADAIAAFESGAGALVRRVRYGPLRSVAEFYLPFRLFRVDIRDGTRTETKWLALDSVRGAFDPYRFEDVPGEADLVVLETRNHALPALGEDEARRLILDKARRAVYGRGVFKIRDLSLAAEPAGLEFHVPYWLGFSGRGAQAHLAVIDAVRGSPEGEKLRSFIRKWLSEGSGALS